MINKAKLIVIKNIILLFYVLSQRCSLSGDEIKQLYNKGGPEAYESSELLLVDLAVRLFQL